MCMLGQKSASPAELPSVMLYLPAWNVLTQVNPRATRSCARSLMAPKSSEAIAPSSTPMPMIWLPPPMCE